MVSRSLKGLFFGLVVLFIGMKFASDKSSKDIMLVAVVTAILMTFTINLFFKGNSELFISGFLITIVESYHFFIQPNVGFLPSLPDVVQLFVGTLIVTRAILFILEIVDTPLRKPIKKLLRFG